MLSELSPSVWAWRAERPGQEGEALIACSAAGPPPLTSSGISKAGILCLLGEALGLALCGPAAGLQTSQLVPPSYQEQEPSSAHPRRHVCACMCCVCVCVSGMRL